MNAIHEHVSGWLYESQQEFDAIDAIPRRSAIEIVFPPPEPLEYVPLLSKRMDSIMPKLLVAAGALVMVIIIISQIIMAWSR